MPTDAGNPIVQFIPFIFIFMIFYFLVIKPERKKQRELVDMRKGIKKNDQVVTAGGMHGTVTLVKEKTVVLRVDENVKVEFDKEAIATILKQIA